MDIQIVFVLWILILNSLVAVSMRDEGFPERRRLRIVTIQMPPYVSFLFDPLLIGNERYEGYYIDLVKELAKEAHFEYQFRLVGDGKIGLKTEEGGWNGMVGEIYREEADLAVGPISVTSERSEIIEFTNPLRQQTIACIQRNIEGYPLWDSIDEALNQRHLKFGIVSSSEIKSFLRNSKDAKIQRIYEKIRNSHGYAYPESTFEALEILQRRNDYILLMEEEVAEYYINKEPCDLHILDRLETGVDLSFAVKNDSDLIAEINLALTRVNSKEILMRRLNRKWWPRDCWGGHQDEEYEGTADYGDKSEISVESQEGSQPIRLTFTTMVNEPYFKFSPEDGVFYEGYIVDLVHHLGRIVPFEHRWMVQTGYGREKKDGTWSGMIGDLISEVADVAAAPFTVNRKASEILTYTKPFHHSSISILLSERTYQSNPILFFEDLLNDTNTEVGVVKGSRIERLFRKSNVPVYREIWKRIVREIQNEHPRRHDRRSRKRKRNNVVDTLAVGINKVRSKSFALLLDSAQANYITSLPPCDLVASDQFTDIANFGFALKKGNAISEKLNDALMQIQQDGILQMLFHKWWMGGECFETPDRMRPVRTQYNETRAPVIVVADDLPHHRFAEEPDFEITTTTTTTTTRPTTTRPTTTTTKQSTTTTRLTTTTETSTPSTTSIPTSTQTTTVSSTFSSTSSSSAIPTKSIEHVESQLDTGQISTTISNPPFNIPVIQNSNTTDIIIVSTTLSSAVRSENKTQHNISPSRETSRHLNPSRRRKKNRKTTTEQSQSYTFKPGNDNGIDWFFQTETPRVEDYEEYELLNDTVNHAVYSVYKPKQTGLNASIPDVLIGESSSSAVRYSAHILCVYIVTVAVCVGIQFH